MNKKKLLITVLTLVLVLSMVFGLVACDNTNTDTNSGTETEQGGGSNQETTPPDPVNPPTPIAPKPIPKNRAVFYFQKDATIAPSMVLIHTDEFSKNATIKDVFDKAWYKYDIKAEILDDEIVKIVSKGIDANARQSIKTYTSVKPVGKNNVKSIQVDGYDFYETNINEKLVEGEAYLFLTTDTNLGSLTAFKKISETLFPASMSEVTIDGNFAYAFTGKELIKYELKNNADNSGKEYVETAKNSNMVFEAHKSTWEDAEGNINTSIYYNLTAKPIIAGDMIICASNGKVQAFDKNTLKSMWVYGNLKEGEFSKGDINSKMVYEDTTQNLYVTFYNTLVCINVKDVDTQKEDESPTEVWANDKLGNFYWDEGIVLDNNFIIGTNQVVTYDENWQPIGSEPAHLFALDKTNGTVKQQIEVVGDIKSGICYDEVNKLLFFTTNAGKLYRVQYKNEASKVFGFVKDIKLEGKESTCTPVINNGRLYVTSGENNYFDINTGVMQVIDVVTLENIYTVDTNGYSQGKPCISVKDEDAFVYFTTNKLEGGIYYIVDNAKAQSAIFKTLFVPSEPQFCANSVQKIGDTLYYSNDSNTIFAYKEFN